MRRLQAFAILALLALAAPAIAQSPDLATLTSQLAKVRTSHGVNQMRDAGPELTPVKQSLRTWVEQQLPPVPLATKDGIVYPIGGESLTRLSGRLNQALDDARLTCGTWGAPGYRCNPKPGADESERGYVGETAVKSFGDDHYLMITTNVGIACGYDQSAYLYDQGADHHWRLLLSIEQNNYGKDDYRPENFLSIDVAAPPNPAIDDAPLVTAIGFGPWCQSNWRSLNTRLWRATPATTTPHPLLDRDDGLYLGGDFIAGARVTDHDLLVQFDGNSIDSDLNNRQHVLHYAIGPSDTLTRISPVALDPGDFVEEWLTTPWLEASNWLSSHAERKVMSRIHAAYKSGTYGEFDGPAKQCRNDPTLWQIAFTADSAKPGAEGRPNYFQVRWQAPYDFALVAAGPNPFPGCDKDVQPPATPPTLFPITGWTP